MKRILLAEIDFKKVEKRITDFIVRNVLEFGYSGAVLGLSGGVDSTLSAIFTKRAFDKYNRENGTNLDLVGFVLPSVVNSLEDKSDGIEVAEKLGIDYEVIEIEDFVRVYDDKIFKLKDKKVERGNLMSRIRANVLHTQSALRNKLVVGTGNRDEDFCLGYYTLFGDGAVHISPLGDLSKRHVRELVRSFGFLKHADREPTAGLEIGQTDFKDLGYSYEFAELVIEGFSQGVSLKELEVSKQVVSLANSFIADSKFDDVKSMISDILRRHKIALKKAELVKPRVCVVDKVYR